MSAQLPDGWVETNLGEILLRISNGYSCDQNVEPSPFPVSRIETIANGDINFEKVKYCTRPSESDLSKYKINPGDILFSHINSDAHLGKSAIFNSNKLLIHGINTLLLRTSFNIDSWFLSFYLKYIKAKGRFLQIAQRAVNQSSINQQRLKNIEIPLPPLNEQRRIVAKLEALFSEVDAAVAQLQAVKQQLTVYRQAVLQAAFAGKLTAAWRAQQPQLPTAAELLADIHTQRAAQAQATGKKLKPVAPLTTAELAELPELPEGWAWVRFGQANSVLSNLVNPLHYLNMPHIAPDNVEKFTGKLLEFKSIGEDKVISPKHLFKPGLIIYSKIRPNLGKVTICNFDGLCSADMYPIEAAYSNRYTFHFMLSKFFIDKSSNIESRTILPKINKEALDLIHFPICSETEQHQIVLEIESRLSVADKLAEAVETSLRQAEVLRQSLLHRAFQGQLVPQDPTDEPASALLARMRAAAPSPRSPRGRTPKPATP